MSTKKIAITIPEPILLKIDKEAERRKISRSRFISQEISKRVEEISRQQMEKKIDQIFSDSEIITEQHQISEKYLKISPLIKEEQW
ncbi:MAG: hypothetical protein ACE5WD_05555 [Candidatus Aminicenantia bacterium]